MNVPVEVHVGHHVAHGRSDRSGHIDLTFRGHGMPPGWHEVTVSAQGCDPVQASVYIVAPDARFGLISDIDDTVITTSLPRPMIAAWNTFFRHENARRVVPGMGPLYRTIMAEHPGAPIIFVSTGAWNTAPTLTRFLKRNGFPIGPLLLTDWGPTNTGWFRSGQDHKRACLDRLAKDFPKIKWLLIGDDGQHDPKIYQDFLEARPQAGGCRRDPSVDAGRAGALARFAGVDRGTHRQGAAAAHGGADRLCAGRLRAVALAARRGSARAVPCR
jgi:phosphatidate phosphatase APP1